MTEEMIGQEVPIRTKAAEIPISGAIGDDGLMSVAFLDDTTLAVLPSAGGALLRFTLDPEELQKLGSERALRGFTETECDIYGLKPSPTLEGIKGG